MSAAPFRARHSVSGPSRTSTFGGRLASVTQGYPLDVPIPDVRPFSCLMFPEVAGTMTGGLFAARLKRRQ